jgi:hypothetical protein
LVCPEPGNHFILKYNAQTSTVVSWATWASANTTSDLLERLAQHKTFV